MSIASKIVVAFTALTLLSACQSSSTSTSTSGSISAPATAPDDVLASRAKVKEFLNGKAFEEYSNTLEVIMISKFGADNRWTQAPLDRDDISSTKISYESDGRVCNLQTKNCFYVRPTYAGFDMINIDGSIGKSLELVSS